MVEAIIRRRQGDGSRPLALPRDSQPGRAEFAVGQGQCGAFRDTPAATVRVGKRRAMAQRVFECLQLACVEQHQGQAEAPGQLLQPRFIGLQADAGNAVQGGQRQSLAGQGLAQQAVEDIGRAAATAAEAGIQRRQRCIEGHQACRERR